MASVTINIELAFEEKFHITVCSSMFFKLSFIHPQIKTPTLLLLGADDLRVPPKQGTNFHRLLKAKGVETRLVRIECTRR